MDPLSLAFGVGFVAAGIALLTVELEIDDLHPSLWWPIPVLFLGLWLLLSALNRTRERDDRSLWGGAESRVEEEPDGGYDDEPEDDDDQRYNE
jgi:hypothetical protein